MAQHSLFLQSYVDLRATRPFLGANGDLAAPVAVRCFEDVRHLQNKADCNLFFQGIFEFWRDQATPG